MRTKYYNHAQEEGSVMIIGGMGLIIAIMIMALLMDMGMYYNSYRRLKAVSDFANEEVTQMLPYYAYSGDYVKHLTGVWTRRWMVMGTHQVT